MPTPIDRARVQALIGEGAQLVEVLPRAEYQDEHGAEGSETRAGAHVRADVPTCRLEERLDESGWDTCFVVDERSVVLGRIRRRAIRGKENVSAEEAMTPGPSTIRPSARLDAMVERMRRQKLSNLPVTTSDGRLVGLLTLRDAEEAVRRLG